MTHVVVIMIVVEVTLCRLVLLNTNLPSIIRVKAGGNSYSQIRVVREFLSQLAVYAIQLYFGFHANSVIIRPSS